MSTRKDHFKNIRATLKHRKITISLCPKHPIPTHQTDPTIYVKKEARESVFKAFSPKKYLEHKGNWRSTAGWARSTRTCPCGEDYQRTTEHELPGALSSPWLSTQLRDTRAAYATIGGCGPQRGAAGGQGRGGGGGGRGGCFNTALKDWSTTG